MISWPATLKQTAIRKEWFSKIARLPSGLDLHKAARMLREPYGAVRRWGVLFGYQFPDRHAGLVSREKLGEGELGQAGTLRRSPASWASRARRCVRLSAQGPRHGVPAAPQSATRGA